MASFTEENYIKSIYHAAEQKNGEAVSTNELAELAGTKAASVTDMLRKLADKDYILYKKYQGVKLTEKGQLLALQILRKHRLWEVFLVRSLGFGWDEIHEIAEQLEHIDSPELTNRLDEFLGFPKFDPHGDPIPDGKGQLPVSTSFNLLQAPKEKMLVFNAVLEDSPSFLQHIDKLKLKLGHRFQIIEQSDFDNSYNLLTDDNRAIHISAEVAKNIQVILE